VVAVIYFAIIERAPRGYGVFFPDLPGCTSAGDTVTEAAINAEEALAGHLLVCEQHGDAIPEPSELDQLEVDSDVDEVARLLVRGERKGKAVRINITLDEGLLAAIDKVAENRSGFLAEAARVALAARREGPTRSLLDAIADDRPRADFGFDPPGMGEQS
jgi:predicted RNase H-like HicB family nuclease